MGIANDITPKIKQPTKETKIEEPKEAEIIQEPDLNHIEIPIDKTGIHKPVYEDIFHDHYNPFEHVEDNHSFENEKEHDFQSFFNQKEASQKHKKSHWFLYIFVTFIVGFLSLLAYQNYDIILEKLGLKDKVHNSDNSSTTNKGVEIINGQDYTDSSGSADLDSINETSSSFNDETDIATTDTSSNSTSPTTTTPTINKSSISIKVLNGNGISGSAAAIKNILVAAGYTIGTVTNASRFTYTNTILYYNSGKEAEAKLIATDLSNRKTELYENSQIAGSNDVIVVVGKN